MRSFGQILREAITTKKLTLRDVARSAGTHKGYISGMCNGNIAPPSAKLIKKLCEKLDLNYYDMLARSLVEKMPKDTSYVHVQDVLAEAIASGKAFAKGRPVE